MFKIRFILFFLATLFYSNAQPEGFRGDTRVLTAIGLMPIEAVFEGMSVYCMTPEGKITLSPVTNQAAVEIFRRYSLKKR